MERLGTLSDDDDLLDDEPDDEQKTALGDHDESGGDERSRRQQQLQQASQRLRKRRKRDSTLCASQLSAVRREITALRAQLDALAQSSPESAEASRSATEALEMEQRIAFLKEKLAAHRVWLQDLRNLLATAPLLDFALRLPESDAEEKADGGGDSSEDGLRQRDSYAIVDEWRQEASGHRYSPILIANHLHASVTTSQDNVSKLLDEFHHSACDFGVTFSSRGWSHAANVDKGLLTFRSSRVIPNATVIAIAAAVWRSLLLEDILRTFVPLVQDVVVVYEAETPQGPVLERLVQLETTGPAETIATIESMHLYGMDGTTCWRIAVETCDDPCLIAYASEEISKLSAQAPTMGSPVIQGAGKNVSQRPDIVLGARCFQQDADVCLEFAGSINSNGAWLVQADSAVELVQFLVCMMPAYEELHLLAKT